MGRIIKNHEIDKLKSDNTLVLVGGCFDIIHEGHLRFLQEAKRQGDKLIVMLESDKKIEEIKGKGRPVNNQATRSNILANLKWVDYVIPLPYMAADKDYEILVKQIEPDIIASTAGNTIFAWEREYINKTGGKIVEVIDRIEDYSTTRIVKTAKL
jgi:D-beta-D-heptose 7-phosphate kinase/D-beta-D-heptose 1-phosphate adenosyltransferase